MRSVLSPLHAWRQLRWVFGYYASHFLDIRGAGQRLEDGEGHLIGYLDELRLWQGRAHLRGWITGGTIKVALDGMTLTRSPTIERRDVAQKLGIDARCGFEGSLPLPSPGAARRLEVTLTRSDGQITRIVPLPGKWQELRARAALTRRFMRACLPRTRMILRAMRSGDPQSRRQIKIALGLNAAPSVGTLIREVILPAPSVGDPPATDARGPRFDRVTIILPVFDAYDLLPEMLHRVEAHTDLPWHLVVIEDCSTDARVRPWLRDRVARMQNRAQLIENARNLGFIASVNRGLAAARALDGQDRAGVVLLNSDAFVPEGWAGRLLAPMQGAVDVASVTPMSNDAEIFSVPVICTRSPLAPGQGDAIDRIAAGLPDRAGVTCDAPTGVGFCMALSPDWLARVEGFDPAFGRGYGEEVDWCRKTAAMGARHLATARLFVEHRGGASFGSDTKAALVAQNNAIITARYPGYDAAVQRFILTDPLLSARMLLALGYLDSLPGLDDVPVWIAHAMGGGADTWLQAQLDGQAPRAAMVIRLGGPARFHVALHCAAGVIAGNCDDADVVLALARRLNRRRVIYSCAVGDPDPASIPALLLALCEGGDGQGAAPLEILFHDFLPLSPSYTLLDSDGVFRGTPCPATTDPAHSTTRPDGSTLDLAGWQALWGAAIAQAARLVVFSRDSRKHVAAVYPGATARIILRPHELPHAVPAIAPAPRGDGEQVIGVLGNIGLHKGAGVLEALGARLARAADDTDGDASPMRPTRLVVIGRVDPAFALGPRATIHGPYRIEDLPGLVARYRITCWLIPSIWPETFSFTTHECLATGLPVMAFDLGAQGAVVAAASNGYLLRLPAAEDRTPGAMAAMVLKGMARIASRSDSPDLPEMPHDSGQAPLPP